jgi:ribosomal-protein-alanine N-acetyltransferase
LIRAATLADLPAIAAIQAASPEASAWNPLDYICSVAESAGEVIAFLVTRETAPGEREILNLAVHPSRRRDGIAKMLVQNALTGSEANWYLEVRESNVAAIALYTSLGFKRAGRRQDYYDDPSEAAIVMSFFS